MERHYHKRCPFFHSVRDRKRQEKLLSNDLCEMIKKGECPRGDKCHMAHNRVEQLYN